MQLLIISKFGNAVERGSSFIPRVGDKIDVFWQPYPVVKEVLLWPTMQTMKELGVATFIDAVITVE